MICRARGCGSQAIDQLCGYHEELVEDGIRILLKRGQPRNGKKRKKRDPQAVRARLLQRRQAGELRYLTVKEQRARIRELIAPIIRKEAS